MSGDSSLSFRARRILYSVVTEYVATGEPVGSRKLARRYGLNLSPASIRNVLADLEDAGYLAQPHTSAGRIPTDAGFRLFVDALVQMREVTADERAAVLHRLKSLGPGQDVMRETGRLLSALTGTAAVVVPPRVDAEPLSQLRFMHLKDGEVLAVMVTRSGKVENRVVRLTDAIDSRELEHIQNYLAERVADKTLAAIREGLAHEVAGDRDDYDELRQRSRAMVDAALTQDSGRPEVVIEGQGRLFDRPEFQSAETIRAFLRTFEEKAQLLDLLDRTLAVGGVQILIGAEAELDDVRDVSVISASYGRGAAGGSVGIIGPSRMDYAKVVPLVEFTARTIGRILEGSSDEDDDDPADG